MNRIPDNPFSRCVMTLMMAFGLVTTPMHAQDVPLTLDEALQRMLRSNRTLQIADQSVEMARSAHRKASATWWPSVQAEGAWLTMSNDLTVDFTLLEHTFSFPLVRQHLADVSLSVTWPLFTGGQRWWGTKIARQGITLAQLKRLETQANLHTTLVTAYYALALARQVTAVREQSFELLERHYMEARQCEVQGVITHADALYARLCRDEAEREWESSRRQTTVAAKALCALMDAPDSIRFQPVTPFFTAAALPADSVWSRTLLQDNYPLQIIATQTTMAEQRIRMSKASYWPTVALVGRQSVYAYHLPRNLLPPSMIGVGFTWTLFDGFQREASVREARLSRHTLTLARNQTQTDLSVALDKLCSSVDDARAQIRSLHTAVSLNAELCRMRRQAFREGMATSTQVADAEVRLAQTRVAMLGAGYEYVVALAALCALAGCPERFEKYLDESACQFPEF